MSKSKGNILDPIDLIDGITLDDLVAKRTVGLMRPKDATKIEKATRRQYPDGIPSYGTDALRFTFAALASPGRDINFDLGRIEGYRNFCNKLWNAARFVFMSIEDVPAHEKPEFGLGERWIQARASAVAGDMRNHYATYRLDLAARAVHSFIWDEFCDWYLEYAKSVLTSDTASDARKRGTANTLITVLDTVLRLAHPLMPFITEEIWQRVREVLAREVPESISQDAYPEPNDFHSDDEALNEFQWLQNFVLGVRRIRAEYDIAPRKALPVLVRGGTDNERSWLDNNADALVALAGIESPVRHDGDDAPESATALSGETTLLIPLAGLIDKDAELARLAREIEKREKEQGRLEGKLGNANFVDRAPAEVVDKERAKLAEVSDEIERLRSQVAKIEGLD